MNISTGLVPHVRHVKVPAKRGIDFIDFGHTAGELPVPAGAEDIWVVELKTPEDTEEHPRGTIKQVLVLTTPPEEYTRGTKFLVSQEYADIASLHEDQVRDRYGIPSDAQVSRVPNILTNTVEVSIKWHELEV